MGEEAGWRDGYAMGIRKGAQIAAEIGFYQGYVHAWIAILEKEDTNKHRKLVALRALLDMTRSFPKTNQIADGDADDLNQRLARIRAKFKQVSTLLTLDGQQRHTPTTTTATTSPASTLGAAHMRRSFAASSASSFNASLPDGSYSAYGPSGGGGGGGSRSGRHSGSGHGSSSSRPSSFGGDHSRASLSHEMSF